jgi:predicted phage-related endonuclease
MISIMLDQDTTTVLSESHLALVEELRSTREFVKKLKAREDEIRKIILQDLKDTERGITSSGVPVLTIDRQTRTRVDSNRLQALYHDVWEDCQIETTVEVLRLPEKD